MNYKDEALIKHLKSSSGVSLALHGPSSESNHHYIDELERFTRCFAEKEAQKREKDRLKTQATDLQRRMQSEHRAYEAMSKDEQENSRKNESIAKKRMLLAEGARPNANHYSLPLNPVTNEIFDSPHGSKFKDQEQGHQAKSLARTRLLQEHSSCGYNLINGYPTVEVSQLVPKGKQGQFSRSLANHYDAVSIKINRSIFHP